MSRKFKRLKRIIKKPKVEKGFFLLFCMIRFILFSSREKEAHLVSRDTEITRREKQIKKKDKKEPYE